MTATIGFERLPRSLHSLLEEAATNLLDAASALDTLLHGDLAAAAVIDRAERDGDRIVHELVGRVGDGRRYGPEGDRLITVIQAFDDVLDALEALAWWWEKRPVAGLAPFLLGIRDLARAAAFAVRADVPEVPVRLERMRESEADARQLGRRARVWLMVVQQDPVVAIAGTTLMRNADRAVLAAARLRRELHYSALE